jgi:tetratricopeptide (TPR) repeat protein
MAFGQFEDTETTLRRGDNALGQGRFDVAQSIYQGALSSHPNLKVSSWRCRNVAEANIRATHPNLKAGADWLQRAVDQDPNDIPSRERLGTLLLQVGETGRAATQYRFLMDENPDNPRYVLGLAEALRNSGQYDEGAKLVSAALQKQPNDASLRVEYARNLLYQRQYAAAKDQYQQVLHWYPSNVDALIGLGKTYSWQGNQQPALEQYQKALVAAPGNYDALVGQGFSLIWSGRQSEAIPMLERANSRHPEVAEVREALKRLNVVNIFTGDVSAGAPEWPIQGPSTSGLPKRASEKGRGNVNSAWNPPAPEPASTSPDSTGKSQPRNAPPPLSSPQPGRSMLWVVVMGLTVLVAVFVVVAFFLFFLPTMQNKKKGKTAIEARLAETKPEPSPVEQWARLEEFSRPERTPREPRSYRPLPPKAPAAPLPLSELLPPPPPSQEIDPETVLPVAFDSAVNHVTETLSAAPAISQELEASQSAPGVVEPGAPAPRPPRRRRGTAASSDQPWWRDLSNPDLVKSAQPEMMPAATPAPPKPPSPFLDVPDEIVLPSDAPNPLMPSSEKPVPPEEPPPARPFTVVLSRALERAGDGQLEEPAEPIKTEGPSLAEYPPNGNGSGTLRSAATARTPAHEVSRELKNANVVIVGCGVMVTHYRAILKAAGADVRAFTFWDLAMSSMRKRHADVLLIDGDALDGFTPAQMYTSSQVERYMYGSILVAVSSEEDRSTLPEDVILAHSLTDEDLRNRFVESLQVS